MNPAAKSPPPAVSVIIPAYRHRDFIQETIDSVFAQTFTDYEVIVINDGSPDDTAEVLRPLAEAGRIRYLEQPNAGQAAARNRGIAEARGALVALLDDDDVWPPDKLSWQVQTLTQAPLAAAVWGSCQVMGSNQCLPARAAPSGEVRRSFRRWNIVVSPGQLLVRAEVLRAIGSFDQSLWGCDDWDLMIRLAERGPILYEHRAALFYRRHASNASRRAWRMHANMVKLRRKHFGVLPRPRDWWDWLVCSIFIYGSTAKFALRACMPPRRR